MPHKGFHTQGLCVLFDTAPSLDQVIDCFPEYSIVKRLDQTENWEFSGPAVVIPYRPEVNGYVSVDIVDRQWPDHMGDGKSEKLLMGAWATGAFGPAAFPGNLQRAIQQCWHWQDGKAIAEKHSSFVRVRSSYVFGVEPEALVMPKDYEALPELMFVSRLARTLLDLPGALCYFNPNGEILERASAIDELFERYRESGLRPLELWSNVRLLRLDEHPPWFAMDTVGMMQLDAPDHEAVFEQGRYDFGKVANFLRNAADYVVENGRIIEDGDTMDGPGGIRWQGATFEDSIAHPPREVIRWLPLDPSSPPKHLLGEYPSTS